MARHSTIEELIITCQTCLLISYTTNAFPVSTDDNLIEFTQLIRTTGRIHTNRFVRFGRAYEQ